MKKWCALAAIKCCVANQVEAQFVQDGKGMEKPDIFFRPGKYGQHMNGSARLKFAGMKAVCLSVVLFCSVVCSGHSGNYTVSDLFGNLGEHEKGAVLMVHFGTTHEDTRLKTIDAMNARMKEIFPDIEVREAWSSRIILRKLEKRGEQKMSPSEALIQLHEEGYTHILIQSTNIIEGTEMKELRREVESLSLNFKDIRMGNPLLYEPEDYEYVIRYLTEAMEKEIRGGQKLLIGHGTPDPATACYAMFDYMLKAKGYRHYHAGTVEGYPGFDEASELLQTGKTKVVTLAPLMFVAGDHAKNDIAGEWKEGLEKQGYQVKLYLKGLGENEGIRELFIRHARFAATHKPVRMGDKKKAYRTGK